MPTMADDETPRKRRPERDDGSDGERRSRKRLSGAKLASAARQQLEEITGMEAETVTGLRRCDDGTWNVTVELLELARIPNTDDVLGSYDVGIDEDGELIGYRRVRRYPRSQADKDLPNGTPA
jgi:hypothetical protein